MKSRSLLIHLKEPLSQNGVLVPMLQSSCSYSTNYRVLKDPRLTGMKRGTGGRSSFNGTVVTVFGATGFLGKYLCNKLGKSGSQLIVPNRSDEYDARRLKLVGDLGQVLFVPFHLQDEESIRKACKYSNVVVNLVGRDWETKNFKFEDVNVDGAARIARIAKEMDVERLIHMSALNASEEPEGHILKDGSKILATKWAGENAVLQEFPEATIFRPSDIYGTEDSFVRHYSSVWRRTIKMMPLWKKGEYTVKQPVFVSDVAQGIVNAIKDPDFAGKIVQAVGPKRYVLSDLVDWFYRVMRRDEDWGYVRSDMRYDPLLWLRVSLTEKLPGTPISSLTWEKLEKDCVTDIVDRDLPTLEDLGVQLTPIEHIAPWLLKPYRHNAYYDEELGEFKKPAPPPVFSG